MIIYKLFHKETNDPLGSASNEEMLADLLRDIWLEDGISSSEITIKESFRNEAGRNHRSNG